MPDQEKQPKRRRWLRFSLRSFLVVLTVGCLAFGYWSNRANQQRTVVKWVEENGGVVIYDYEVDANGQAANPAETPGPEVVRVFLGKDYLASVTAVLLNNTKVEDVTPLASLSNLRTLSLRNTPVSDLKPLAGLTKLKFLILDDTNVNDVTPLAGMTSLKSLELHSAPVTDVESLAGLSNLDTLVLSNTKVKDVTPLAGAAGLKYLYLDHTSVADVRPLMGLTKLESLTLKSTPVSQDQLESLRSALPNWVIDSGIADRFAP